MLNLIKQILAREYQNITETKTTKQASQQTVVKLIESVNPPSIGISTDSWTSVFTQSYLSVMVHFLTHTSEPITLIMGVIPTNNHTAVHTTNEIESLLNGWHIRDRIEGMVGDTTASNPATAKELGIKYHGCNAHEIALAVNHALSVVSITPFYKLILYYYLLIILRENFPYC